MNSIKEKTNSIGLTKEETNPPLTNNKQRRKECKNFIWESINKTKEN